MEIKLLSLTLVLFAALDVNADSMKHYDGHQVLHVYPTTRSQLKYLHDLEMNSLDLNFWTYPSSLNSTVDIMVPPNRLRSFKKSLAKRNMAFKVMIEDAEQAFKRQREEVVKLESDDPSLQYFTAYRRLADIFTQLQSLQTSAPSITAIENIGRSYGNRDLRLIKIGVNYNTNTKPIMFIDGGIHAREWISPQTVTYLATQLVNGYNSGNSQITTLLNTFDWYILPSMNPDGYEYTHTNERLWRKTRSPNSGSTCVGTDPNRNYDDHWNEVGASTNPCSETYAGTGPFSEIETKTVADYINARRTRIKGYFNVHSYGQYWIFPYGWTSALTPDHAKITAAANAATSALNTHYGTRYTVGTSTNVLYAAAGGADDWSYSKAGITYSYCVELRDTGSYGFTLPASQIIATGTETASGFYAIATHIGQQLGLLSNVTQV